MVRFGQRYYATLASILMARQVNDDFGVCWPKRPTNLDLPSMMGMVFSVRVSEVLRLLFLRPFFIL